MKKQKANTYGVRLSGLWLSFRLMKFFALLDARKSAESIQLHINEADKKVTSVINRLCANYIACHRDLIVGAFLNKDSKNTEEVSGKTTDSTEENKSIIQRKRELLNAENARNAARVEKSRKAESDATLLPKEYVELYQPQFTALLGQMLMVFVNVVNAATSAGVLLAALLSYVPDHIKMKNKKIALKTLWAEVKAFKEGLENYIDGRDDFQAYENQYVELSADYFAEEETDELLRTIFNSFIGANEK